MQLQRSCGCNHFLKMYVINPKIIQAKIIPYAFGNYIHTKAWLHTNPSDWIKNRQPSNEDCRLFGRSEETRGATPYDSLRENPIVFGFAEGRSSLFLDFFNTKNNESQPKDWNSLLVGVKRLELPTFWSQTRRATNCATPRLKICLQSIDIIANNVLNVNS